MIYVIGDCFVRDLGHTEWDKLSNKKDLVIRGHPGQGPFKFSNFLSILIQIQEFMERKIIPPSTHQLLYKNIFCMFYNPSVKCDHSPNNDLPVNPEIWTLDKCKPFMDNLKKLQDEKNSIIFWFGHADNRDARCNDETRKEFMQNNINLYINNIKKFLGNHFTNIYIAEPFPIFINKWELEVPNASIHKKLKNEKVFLDYLRKACAENNIEILITQQEILDAAGVDFFDDANSVKEYYTDDMMLPISQQKNIWKLLCDKVSTIKN